MELTRHDREDVSVLRLDGEFDSFEAGLVREAFESCLRDGRHRIVVDLAGLAFANSTTIATLITAQQRVQAAGGGIVLAAPRDFLRRTLRTLGLDRFFTFADTVDEAANRLKSA